MKPYLLFILPVVFSLLCGCASMQVKHSYDTEQDFSLLKTFEYLPQPEGAQTKEHVLELIKTSVTNQLSRKDIENTNFNPDMLVAIHTKVKSKTDIKDWGYEHHSHSILAGRDGYYGERILEINHYEEGTLILDFIKADTKHLIWRGIASDALPEKPGYDELRKLIDEAITKMLKDYPPSK
jgi:hypothetical protein